MKYFFYIAKSLLNPISNLTIEKKRDPNNFLVVRTSFVGTLTLYGDDFLLYYNYANQQIEGEILEYNEIDDTTTIYNVIYSFSDTINVGKKIITCEIIYYDIYTKILENYDRNYYSNKIGAQPIRVKLTDDEGDPNIYYDWTYTVKEIITKILNEIDGDIIIDNSINILDNFVISNEYLSKQNFRQLEHYTTKDILSSITDSEAKILDSLSHNNYLYTSLNVILTELRDIFGYLWVIRDNKFIIATEFKYENNINLSEFSNIENEELSIERKYNTAEFLTKNKNNTDFETTNINFNYSNENKIIINQKFDTYIPNPNSISNSSSELFMINSSTEDITLNQLYGDTTTVTSDGYYYFFRIGYAASGTYPPAVITTQTNNSATWTSGTTERLTTRGFFGYAGDSIRIKFTTNIDQSYLFLYKHPYLETPSEVEYNYGPVGEVGEITFFDETITLTSTGMFWLVFNEINSFKENYIEDFELIALNQKVCVKYNGINNAAFAIKNILENYNQHLLFNSGTDDDGNEYNFLIKNNIQKKLFVKLNLLFEELNPFYSYLINNYNYRLERVTRKIRQSTKQTEEIILSTDEITIPIYEELDVLSDIDNYLIQDYDGSLIEFIIT